MLDGRDGTMADDAVHQQCIEGGRVEHTAAWVRDSSKGGFNVVFEFIRPPESGVRNGMGEMKID